MTPAEPILNTRAVAANVLTQVLSCGRSLTVALEDAKSKLAEGRDRALLQSLCYGTLRWYFRLDAILDQLLLKALKKKDLDIRVLALLGLYQIAYTRIKEHAAVAETVAAAGSKSWAKALLNAVLRNYLRNREELDRRADSTRAGRSAHPQWMLDEFERCWPGQVDSICAANNEFPPMVLRVNRLRCSRDDYKRLLEAQNLEAFADEFNPEALRLAQPIDVARLPGFADGLVSVQDSAAQCAAQLLEIRPGQRVLDACAAPGGKTAHILELGPDAEVFAIDVDRQRAEAISHNLERLGLRAQVMVSDLLDPSSWWDGAGFDRILLDAPCSATGVIRRHPDIKVLRRPGDIKPLVLRQNKMLDRAWSMLVPGGILVYSTCSLLKSENVDQIEGFLKSHEDCTEMPIDENWGFRCCFGRQILPGESEMDGFYFARLQKLG